jgi:hypothetical protein
MPTFLVHPQLLPLLAADGMATAKPGFLDRLILERKSDLTDVFFVNRRTLPWPPEPVRTLAARAIRGYMRWEDRRFDP